MFEQAFKNIDDLLWKEAGCTTELNYTEQTSWMLFLKYLDDLEHERALQAELTNKPYTPIIDDEHRWSRWAAPKTPTASSTTTMRSPAQAPPKTRSKISVELGRGASRALNQALLER